MTRSGSTPATDAITLPPAINRAAPCSASSTRTARPSRKLFRRLTWSGVPFQNFPAATAHSVAANPHNNHVFVPLGANNIFPDCLNGCVAVYTHDVDEDRDRGRDDLDRDRR